jgi:hypothetical protein
MLERIASMVKSSRCESMRNIVRMWKEVARTKERVPFSEIYGECRKRAKAGERYANMQR